MGDLSGIAERAAAEVLGIPLGIMFALGVAAAGFIRRPLGLVCILAVISTFFNLSLLWYFSSDLTWTWLQATPIFALALTLAGVFAAWIKKESRSL